MAGLLVEKTIGGEDLVFDFLIGEKEASLGRIVAISRNDVECGLLVILGSAFLFFQSLDNWYFSMVNVEEFPAPVDIEAVPGLQLRVSS